MASIQRVHGTSAAGAFFGYTPIVVKVAATGIFTADTVNATTGAITEGGYAVARKILQNYGSIVWLGARDVDNFTAIVDQPTLNQVGGPTTTTALGALKDALTTALGGTHVVTVATALVGAGTFTFVSP